MGLNSDQQFINADMGIPKHVYIIDKYVLVYLARTYIIGNNVFNYKKGIL